MKAAIGHVPGRRIEQEQQFRATQNRFAEIEFGRKMRPVHWNDYHIDMSSIEDIQRRIIELEVEHRDLDAVIDTLVREGHRDELQLRRLKKRKLQLKDNIMLLKMQLVPDIPA
jgi:hypothetical protein